MNVLNEYRMSLIGVSLSATALFCLKRFYFDGGVCKSKKRLDGQTVIITGANTGIGKETALDLARRGARVILACRDMTKAMKAAEEIRAKSGNGNVFAEYVDLSSLESIHNFAKKINDQEEKINILINNAGIMACPKWTTRDGFEMQFGVNHLGHFLLTNLLLDKIKASGPSRIVNVSSLAQEKGKMNWDDLMHDKSYEPWPVYRQSKLANVLFTRELAKRLKGTQTTCSALHPGVVRTELGRYMKEQYSFFRKMLFAVFTPLILLIFKSASQGAQTSIYCAVSEELDNVSGCYFSDCTKKSLKEHALNDDDAKKLWQISEKLVNLE